MAKLPLINGWEIGWSRDIVIAALRRGGDPTSAEFNVAFAHDAAEAAYFLQEEIDKITVNWEGNEQDLELLYNFIRRFHK